MAHIAEKEVFQFLIGILKTRHVEFRSELFLSVSIPHRYSKNELFSPP